MRNFKFFIIILTALTLLSSCKENTSFTFWKEKPAEPINDYEDWVAAGDKKNLEMLHDGETYNVKLFQPHNEKTFSFEAVGDSITWVLQGNGHEGLRLNGMQKSAQGVKADGNFDFKQRKGVATFGNRSGYLVFRCTK